MHRVWREGGTLDLALLKKVMERRLDQERGTGRRRSLLEEGIHTWPDTGLVGGKDIRAIMRVGSMIGMPQRPCHSFEL